MSDIPHDGTARRFEVILPPEHTTLQRLAFMSMVNAFGWNSKETTPDTTIVDSKALLAVSEQLFGNESAGKLANDVLDCYTSAATGSVYSTTGASGPFRSEDPYRIVFNHGNYVSLRGFGLKNYPNTFTLPQELHDALAKGGGGYPAVYMPLDFAIHSVQATGFDYYGYKTMRISPLKPTKDRVKGYVDFRMQQDKTPPRGAVAKMMQALATAAGTSVSVADEDPKTVFMPVETLLELGQQAGLSAAMLKKLSSNIHTVLVRDALGEESAYSAYGLANNEIVFGGETRIGKVDTISVDSIPKLVKTYGGETPSIDFLKSFEDIASTVDINEPQN